MLRKKTLKCWLESRNERPRLRHAFLPRAIHGLLLRLADPLPSPPPHASPRLALTYPIQHPATTLPLRRRARLRRHCRVESDLFELP